MDTLLKFLPQEISLQISKLPREIQQYIEEIRMRINRPLEIIVNGRPQYLPGNTSIKEAEIFLSKISKFSMYTIEEELRQGYITISGGHRIGFAGKVILSKGEVKAIRDVSSFNIRVAREKIGAAEKIVSNIYRNRWLDTIIIGPPQTGKTTLLRDIARIISSGCTRNNIKPLKVGIVDERSEIAGSVSGIPQLTFGNRIDILDGCPKAEGMMMLIRSMSPDVIIVDEIGRQEDCEAINDAVNSGVTIITTMHGNSLEDVKKRPITKKIIEQGSFTRFIEIKRGNSPGSIVNIKDEKGRVIINNEREAKCLN